MLDESAAGVFTIAVTPFLPDGALDLSSIDRMVDFYVEKGATGLTILGMMGEAGKLSAEEAVTVVRRVTARTALPVVVGVSAPGFAAMQALTAQARDAGAAGVMVAPPATLKTDDQIVAYYRNAAEALGDMPFVLQDFPLATDVHFAPGVILRIAEACPTCVMLKHEDWPGLDKISALRKAHDAGARRISILTGFGAQFLPEEMGRGADGAMTGYAFPEMMAEIVRLHHEGAHDAMFALHAAHLPLIRYEGQPGIGLAVRKHVLARRGAIAHPTLRRPAPALSAESVAEVEGMLARLERSLAALA